MAKAQFVTNLPWRFLVGANILYQTGRLWSRQVRVAGLGFPSRPMINIGGEHGRSAGGGSDDRGRPSAEGLQDRRNRRGVRCSATF